MGGASLVDTEALRHGQQQDSLLERVTSHLLDGEVSTDPEGKLDTRSYLTDDRDLSWYAPGGKEKPVSVIHRALEPDLIVLVHAMHDHPGVASTLALLRESFHLPTMTRDMQEREVLEID